VLVSLLIVISFIDIREQLVFDSIVIPGAVCGFLLSLPTWRDSLFGILFFFVVYLIIILVSKLFYKEGGMGEGDLTTGVMIGAFIGLRLGIVSFLLSFIVGAIVGVILLIRNKDSKAEIPFVPYMSIGALLAIFWKLSYFFLFEFVLKCRRRITWHYFRKLKLQLLELT